MVCKNIGLNSLKIIEEIYKKIQLTFCTAMQDVQLIEMPLPPFIAHKKGIKFMFG